LNNRNNSSEALHSQAKTQLTIIPRNEPQHISKKSSIRTLILQTTPDLTNLPKIKVKVTQRVNALITILLMMVMMETTGMTLMALMLIAIRL